MEKLFLIRKILLVALGSAVVFSIFTPTAYAEDRLYSDEFSRAVDTNLSHSYLNGVGCQLKEPYTPKGGGIGIGPITGLLGIGRAAHIDAVPGATPITGNPSVSVPLSGSAFLYKLDAIWYCPPGTLDQARDENQIFREEFTAPIGGRTTVLEDATILVFSRAFWVLGIIGAWILWLASQALIPLLTAKFFITNPLVVEGWPIVQGIANLGFVIAMLAIAGSTVLRIESYNARRMIPRLLIAALLINFSLVVGGVLIDTSRLIMAIIIRALTNGNVEQLAKSILEGTQVVKSAYDTSTLGLIGLNSGSSTWSWLKDVIISTILIWALAVSFAVIAVGLLIRYVMLILLLIVSPIAYVAFALPKADGIARAWWSNFIKYVIYGPVAILVLALVTVAGDMFKGGKNALGEARGGSFLDTVFQIAIVCALAVGAAVAGKYLGTKGAATTVGFVTNRSKQAARFAGGAALTLTGTRAAGRAIKRNAQEASTAVQTGIGRNARAGNLGSIAKFVAGPKRKKDGTLEEGETSLGQRFGQRISRDPKARSSSQTEQRAKSVSPTKLGIDDIQSNPNLEPPQLTDATFVTNLDPKVLGAIMELGTDPQRAAVAAALSSVKVPPGNAKEIMQITVNKSLEKVKNAGSTPENKESASKVLRALASNQNLVDKMDDKEKSKILNAPDPKASSSLLRTLAKISSKKNK